MFDDEAPDELGDRTPGPDLAGHLAALVAADANDAALIEAVAAWDRLAAWVAVGQARVIAELLARCTSSSETEFLGAEIAARLAVSRTAADRLVALAVGTSLVPAVGDALVRGDIGVAKAHVLLDSVGHLPLEARRRVIATVLPLAPGMTGPELRRRVRRTEIEIDPSAADRRHEAARRGRFVRLDPAEDAMAWLTAYLPADQAVAAYEAIDAAANAARLPGDGRDADARRADVLVAALGTALGGATHVDVVRAVDPAEASGGLPGSVAGPKRAPGAVSGAESGVAGRAAAPVVSEVASGAGSEPTSRPGFEHPSGSGPTTTAPAGSGSTATVRPGGARRAVARGTLLLTIAEPGDGRDARSPARLAGYGPVPAAIAERLVARASSSLVLADRVTGVLLPGVPDWAGAGTGAAAGADAGADGRTVADMTSRSYRPRAQLAAYVVARDSTCRFPGCHVPAWRCDLDHIVPFDDRRPAVEQTTAGNLQPLCRFHHRLKTHGGWRVERDPLTAATTWTSPTGQGYVCSPHRVDPSHPDGTAVTRTRRTRHRRAGARAP
ncbi:hypothetical protein AGMMS50218_13760 [Actinomycetota bacterium]|nr:hypothetical protein AGMMS50218_13760 [Actinomycetota bacterium]